MNSFNQFFLLGNSYFVNEMVIFLNFLTRICLHNKNFFPLNLACNLSSNIHIFVNHSRYTIQLFYTVFFQNSIFISYCVYMPLNCNSESQTSKMCSLKIEHIYIKWMMFLANTYYFINCVITVCAINYEIRHHQLHVSFNMFVLLFYVIMSIYITEICIFWYLRLE